MPESDLHLTLKRAACRWLWSCGYAAIAEEVEVPGVGIIDAAAAGRWKRYNPREVNFEQAPQVERCHAVFVECKAFRADFLRDQGRQKQFAFALAERKQALGRRVKRRPLHASAALGKFDCCLLRPHAHLHYLLTPPRLLKAEEVPRRWGWLVYEDRCVRVVRKAAWQEVACIGTLEGAIARALTAQRMRVYSANGPQELPAQPGTTSTYPPVVGSLHPRSVARQDLRSNRSRRAGTRAALRQSQIDNRQFQQL